MLIHRRRCLSGLKSPRVVVVLSLLTIGGAGCTTGNSTSERPVAVEATQAASTAPAATTTTSTTEPFRVEVSSQLWNIDPTIRLEPIFSPLSLEFASESRSITNEQLSDPDLSNTASRYEDLDHAVCDSSMWYVLGLRISDLLDDRSSERSIDFWLLAVDTSEKILWSCRSREAYLTTLTTFPSTPTGVADFDFWSLYGCFGRNFIESTRYPSTEEVELRDTTLCADFETEVLQDLLSDPAVVAEICEWISTRDVQGGSLTKGDLEQMAYDLDLIPGDTVKRWPITSQARSLLEDTANGCF